MALTRVDSGGQILASTGAAATFGTTPVAGDVITVFVGTEYGTSVDTPSGYTLLGSVNGYTGGGYSSYTTLYAFVKTSVGSETGLTPTYNGGPQHTCCMWAIYRGDIALSWSTLMSAANVFDYPTSRAYGPAWGALPTTDVVAICGGFTTIPDYFSTSDSVSGTSWTDRFSTRIDTTEYGSSITLFAGLGTNENESLNQCEFYVYGSSTTGTLATLMVYVYEAGSGKRSKLILGM